MVKTARRHKTRKSERALAATLKCAAHKAVCEFLLWILHGFCLPFSLSIYLQQFSIQMRNRWESGAGGNSLCTCGPGGSKGLCLCANRQQQIKFHLSHYLFGDEAKRCRRRRLHFVFAEACFTFRRRTQRAREWRKAIYMVMRTFFLSVPRTQREPRTQI